MPKRGDIPKLKTENIRSNKELINNIENIQAKLNKLGHNYKPYSKVIAEIRKKHYKEKHFENLLNNKKPIQFNKYITPVIVAVNILVIGSLLFYFTKNPTITGAAVKNITEFAASRMVSLSFGTFVAITILGVIIGARHYKKKCLE